MKSAGLQLAGKQFRNLTVIKKAHVDGKIRSHWVCKCKCGNTTVVSGGNLKSGNTKSCGCLNWLPRITHGGSGTKEWQAWVSMRARCYHKTNSSYKNYGGRGITVCSQWRASFSNFIKDMGKCPPEMSIDRIDCRKGYSKTNCRWADIFTQMNNRTNSRRVLYKGSRQTIAEISRASGIKYSTIYQRIFSYGWPVSLATKTQARKKRQHYGNDKINKSNLSKTCRIRF